MTSIARTSFSPSIASPTDENAKRDAFLAWVSGAAPPGIACVATRAHAAGIAAALAGESPFAVGDSAVHVRRGAGTVVGQGDGAVTALFGDAGYRTLDLALALAEELLTAAFDAAGDGS